MAQHWWKPVWSVPAAMRAARATVVIPSLFAITDKVIGDPQMALFATFGGFATLIIAGFNGTRRDKLTAHLGLAIAGSIVLIIGTLVSGTTWLAAVVTIPVTFAIFFAGVGGPNAASGSTAAMFAYVLPVASAGNAGMIGSRLAGWWLASVAGTIAVLLLSPRPPGSQLRAAAADLAGQLAGRIRAAAAGEMTRPDAIAAAKERLRTAFSAAPFRPTGLATADQALSSLVQLLEWGATAVGDAFDGHIDLSLSCDADRDLLRAAAGLLDDTAGLLSGQDPVPDFAAVEAARARSAKHLRELSGRPGEPDARLAAAQAVHAQGLSVVAESAAADALIVAHRASEATIAAERRQWYGTVGSYQPVLAGTQAGAGARAGAAPAAAGSGPGPAGGGVATAPARAAFARDEAAAADGSAVTGTGGRLAGLASSPRVAGLAGAVALVRRHASVRSVWFLNSLRGALALAAAVAIADTSGLQHGFWVVLGTLSVLRTSAAATGATAWRALAGTAVGFVVGAALLVGIGTAEGALWVALPLAVLVAAYAPGTTPFLVGQASFTVTIVVLFNLLAPAGWKVGLLRVEDVAIGCAVSVAVGLLFWPRGVSSIVADDLADAFRAGAVYLRQAVDWALSELLVPPAAAVAAASAGIRLDDAVRGFLTEQGSKRLSKDDLWALVNATTRLRLSAHTLAGLRTAAVEPGVDNIPGAACLPLEGSEDYAGAPACMMLQSVAGNLAGFYDAVADEMTRPGSDPLTPVPPPVVTGPAMPRSKAVAGAVALANGAAPETAAFRASSAAPADDPIAPAHQLPHPHLLWVQEHLHHLSESAQTVSAPAMRLAEVRQRPWWR
jgi:Fusaric acid resistance protein-like